MNLRVREHFASQHPQPNIGQVELGKVRVENSELDRKNVSPSIYLR